MIMSLTGVDEETASAAYLRYETTEDAIDFLIQKPTVAGDKYIPAKRKIDTGMSQEQEERCKKGRWLQDQVNVVFSVAHSKIRTQQALSAEQTEELPAVTLPTLQEEESQLTTELLPDSHAKTTLQVGQSESLP